MNDLSIPASTLLLGLLPRQLAEQYLTLSHSVTLLPCDARQLKLLPQVEQNLEARVVRDMRRGSRDDDKSKESIESLDRHCM